MHRLITIATAITLLAACSSSKPKGKPVDGLPAPVEAWKILGKTSQDVYALLGSPASTHGGGDFVEKVYKVGVVTFVTQSAEGGPIFGLRVLWDQLPGRHLELRKWLALPSRGGLSLLVDGHDYLDLMSDGVLTLLDSKRFSEDMKEATKPKTVKPKTVKPKTVKPKTVKPHWAPPGWVPPLDRASVPVKELVGQRPDVVEKLLGVPGEKHSKGAFWLYTFGQSEVAIYFRRKAVILVELRGARIEKKWLEAANWGGLKDVRPFTVAGKSYVVDTVDGAIRIGEKNHYAALKKKEQRAAKKSARARAIKARARTAAAFRQALLDDRIESQVRTTGRGRTTIRVTSFICGSVFLSDLDKKNVLRELKTSGFKKLLCSNGYRTWTQPL